MVEPVDALIQKALLDEALARVKELERELKATEGDLVWVSDKAARIEKALREVEWCHESGRKERASRWCPSCGNYERYGHREKCTLAAALSGSRDGENKTSEVNGKPGGDVQNANKQDAVTDTSLPAEAPKSRDFSDDAERVAMKWYLGHHDRWSDSDNVKAIAALLRERDRATWARAVEMLRAKSPSERLPEVGERLADWLAERGPK